VAEAGSRDTLQILDTSLFDDIDNDDSNYVFSRPTRQSVNDKFEKDSSTTLTKLSIRVSIPSPNGQTPTDNTFDDGDNVKL
jgi:hypothetical protein